MLDVEKQRAASDLLWEHWQSGRTLDALPIEIRPTDRAEGYAIQALLEKRSRQPLFGWKIAATSTAGQHHIGVDGPLVGRLLRERAFESGATLPARPNLMRVAEPEFAFRMARALPPREAQYSTSEVLDAVGSLHPAIEVPDSRYADFPKVGAPQLIADNACANLFVLGSAVAAPWRAIDLSQHAVQATVRNQTFEGKGANVLGDPRVALTWLANELSRYGMTLGKDEVVTTGTCMTPIAFQEGDHVVVDYGVLGKVEVKFEA